MGVVGLWIELKVVENEGVGIDIMVGVLGDYVCIVL